MTAWLVILLGLVEGLTEFLPVSSTGHLILVSAAFDFTGPLADSFNVIVQLGAILAVLGLYHQRFRGLLQPATEPGFSGWRGVGFLLITSAPALILGKLLHDVIKERLFSPQTVAIGLAVGGVAILLLERRRHGEGRELDGLTWRIALGVGLVQCLALWPGVSRSAATILGGLLLGLNRRGATEYSFFAAMPVLGAAALYDILKGWPLFTAESVPLFLLGMAVAFVSAWLAMKFLVRFVSNHSFAIFAWYRIALAAVVFLLLR
jgi:undecaprenyl-diphosphatase